MTRKTLPRQPWLGGQLCGRLLGGTAQTGDAVYCGENKARSSTLCMECDDLLSGEINKFPEDDRIQAIRDRYPPDYSTTGVHISWTVRNCWVAYAGSVLGSGPEIDSDTDRALLELRVGVGVLKWEGENGEPVDPIDPELWEFQGRREVEAQCKFCYGVYSVWVFPADMDKLIKGEGHVQELMPYLTLGERELMTHRMCEPCFDRFCPPDED